MKVRYKNNGELVTFSEALNTTTLYSHKSGEQFKRTYENKIIGGKKPIARFNRDLIVERGKQSNY